MVVRRLLETSQLASQAEVRDKLWRSNVRVSNLTACRQFAGYCDPGLKGSEAYMLGNAGSNA
jgi:hypothetical protein